VATAIVGDVRIGMVSPYSLSVPGGVQGQVLGLARTLRALGHEVRVLAPCDGPPPDAGVTPLGPSLSTPTNGSMAPISPGPVAQLRTIRALRDEAFDVVHLHEPFVPGPTQTAILVKLAPLVGTFHAAGDDSAYRSVLPIVRAAARSLDVRVAVSEEARTMAAANVGGRFELLFNGVEVASYRDAEPWPTDGPTILFCGRHEPRKGLAVLLDAMAHLPPSVRLWIASDGPDTAALQARSAGDDRIVWLGRIDDDEKARRLRGADVFCAPSLGGESFGVVLLEAMAAGTAVVASDLVGYATVARDGQDAQLVPPGDAIALAEAIQRVLDDPGLAARLVASGAERAASFSMEQLAADYLALYEQAIAIDRRRRRRPRRTALAAS
jgi:phosphatidylinositol alpha-mannosyltransferase